MTPAQEWEIRGFLFVLLVAAIEDDGPVSGLVRTAGFVMAVVSFVIAVVESRKERRARRR